MRNWMTRFWPRFSHAFFREGGVFYFLFLLLLLPMFWYALRTRFALIDDYNSWFPLTWDDSGRGIGKLLHGFMFSERERFRPLFHIYNFGTWLLLGQDYSLHHATRIGLKLLTGYFFWRSLQTWTRATPGTFHLPSFVFWALFLFVPNNPEARLAPQETLLAVNLAWLLWGLTRLVWRYQGDLFANRLLFGEIFLAFILFNLSKESAVPLSFAIIVFLFWISLSKPSRLPGVLLLISVMVFPLLRSIEIYNLKIYGTASLSANLVLKNLSYMLEHLTFYTTQPFWVVLFVFVAGWLIYQIIQGIRGLQLPRNFKQWILSPCSKPEYSRPVLGLLWGLVFASAFILGLSSWKLGLRYIYIPTILWIVIIALAVDIPVNTEMKLRFWITRGTVVLGFLFIFSNYYNFVYQFAAQYYTRANESRMLKDVRMRLENGDTIYVIIETEFQAKIKDYFLSYLPYFEKVKFPNIHFADATQLYGAGIYYLTLTPDPLPGHVLEREYLVSRPSTSLEWINKFSQLYNFGQDPFHEVDDGSQFIGSSKWYLYKNTLSIDQILSGERVEFIDPGIVIPARDSANEVTIPLTASLKPDHFYAALVDFNAESVSRMDFQMVHDNTGGPLYIAIGDSSRQNRRMAVVFGPVQGDGSPAVLVVANRSSNSDAIITRVELLDLGKIQ